ncbi:TlpA disulfide reductase family protein [Porticoccus sp. W117]|uniref:TlpA family protein disulfide reductase n=1 Tax=Porticoccus sp. W117 TaxID=3054777 RepID=UPI002594DCEE|nr:TlpA disulfide reductase family protein [Porticoccus sp. W117]MDM3871975.1 TlpA disulfide reductase family protein [Porticoccus sp. W117]
MKVIHLIRHSALALCIVFISGFSAVSVAENEVSGKAKFAQNYQASAQQLLRTKVRLQDFRKKLPMAKDPQEKATLKAVIEQFSNGAEVPVEQLNNAIATFENHNGQFSDEVMDAMILISACALLAEGETQAIAKPYLPKVQDATLTKAALARIEDRLSGFSSDINFYQSVSDFLRDYRFINRLFDTAHSSHLKDGIAGSGTWNINDFVTASDEHRPLVKAQVHKFSDYYLKRYDQPEIVKQMSDSEKLNLWRMRGSRYHVDYLDIGMTLPELAFNGLDGNAHTTDQYRGNFLLLDFWTTTCGPCKKAMPDKDALVKQMKAQSKAFQLVSIACDEDIDDVHLYREEDFPMDWTNWHFPANTQHGESLAIRAYPTYILVSPQGEILETGNDFDAMAKIVRDSLK